MDFFTHLMVGFIISSLASGSFHNNYVLFGTLMAGLPDFDVFLYPLWKSLPITRHHGITHMIIFIVIVSALVNILLAVFAGSADVNAIPSNVSDWYVSHIRRFHHNLGSEPILSSNQEVYEAEP